MTGEKPALVEGSVAAAEAAFRVGCRFFAGYPISPANQVMDQMRKLLKGEGTWIQMEDEMAAISAVIGASLSGVKAMTATSGPGQSLMQEGVGYAYFTETPIVIIDVQRAGPATGQATCVGQGDVMQMRFGSHGDVYPIALSPWSVSDLYELTIRAFNLAEKYRVPVYVATDASVARMKESAVLGRDFEIVDRVRDGDAPPFGSDEPDGVPPMPAFGDGKGLLVTGSTHDERGFRRVDDPQTHEKLVTRLMQKTMSHVDDIVETDAHFLDDAKMAFFSYGISARSAMAAVRALREAGFPVGLMRTRTLWPFPSKAVRALGDLVEKIIVPECNTGQVAEIVRGLSRALVIPFPKTDGLPISPEELARFVKGVM